MKKLIIFGALLLPMISPAQDTTETSDAVDKAAIQSGSMPAKVTAPLVGILADPIPTGLQLWLRASTGISVGNGAAVSVWMDESGNGRNAVYNPRNAFGEKAPIYDASNAGVNGEATVRFNNKNALDLDLGFLTGSDYTIFVVNGRDRKGLANFYIAGDTGVANSNLILGYERPNFLRQAHYGNDLDAVVESYNGAEVYSLDAFRLAQASGRDVFHNGRVVASGTNTLPLLSNTNSALGHFRVSKAYWFRGDLAEIVVYDRALNDAEMLEVGNYLATRYGFAGTPVTPVAPVAPAVVRGDQLVVKDGLYFPANSEVPYSGAIRERYPSGLTETERNVVDGIADSAVSEWYANGEQKGDEAQDMPASNITVSLLAGKLGEKGGAGGIGSEARFWDLRGAVVEPRGSLVVLDGNRIRVVLPSGVFTLAGSGQPGYVDGKGADARFCNPRGIAIDSAGNLYIADTGNNKIRKVTMTPPDFNVSTYAGEATIFAGQPTTNGSCLGNITNSEHLYLEKHRAMTLEGIAIDAHDNVFVSDVTNQEIYKITPNGEARLFASHAHWGNFKDGQGIAARFSNPVAIKIDSENNLYVADQDNRRIRKISPDGAVSTLAGSNTYSDSRMRQKNTAKWIGRNEGPGLEVQFSRANNVGVDESGNAYVATDAGFQKITPDGQVSVFKNPTKGIFADGPLAEAKFSDVFDFAFDSDGNMLITDYQNSRIRKITPSGTVSTVAGSVDAKGSSRGRADGPVLTAQLYFPTRLAVDGFGNMFVAQAGNQIRKITPDGIVSSIGGNESCIAVGNSSGLVAGNAADGQFCTPLGIAADAIGNVYVADSGNAKIKKINSDGVVSTLAGTTHGYADGPIASAKFNEPKGVAVDPDGNIFVADTGNDNIRRISVDGIVSTVAGSSVEPEPRAPLWGSALAVDAGGNVYSAGASVYRQITKITPDGEELTTFAGAISGVGVAGGKPSFEVADGDRSAARFWDPSGLSFDNKGNLYVADSDEDSDKTRGRVRKVTPDGIVSTVNGAHRSEWIGRPSSVAVGADGVIFVLDRPNHRIFKVELTQEQ